MIDDITKMENLQRNVSLKNYSTVKIGGTAKYFLNVGSVKQLRDAIYIARQTKLPYIVIGNGSNILFDDEKYDGLVICTKNLNDVIVNGNLITAMCGASINKLLTVAKENELGGLEFLYGIPATVGGAVCSNAGAFGFDVSECLVYVDVLKNGHIIRYEKSRLNFRYRKCGLNLKNQTVVSATFMLKSSTKRQIADKMNGFYECRKKSQPNGYSLGCTFKNLPEKNSAFFIEKIGLKGYNIGDAVISKKHANFFINLGNATFEDYKALIDFAKQKVLEKFNVVLEEEIKIVSQRKKE